MLFFINNVNLTLLNLLNVGINPKTNLYNRLQNWPSGHDVEIVNHQREFLIEAHFLIFQ